MALIRMTLIVVLTLAASLSGATGADHMSAVEHDRAGMQNTGDEVPMCCDDSTERGQNCHVIAAVLADTDDEMTEPQSRDVLAFSAGLLLAGTEPSGPLDPPRRR